MFLDKWLVRLVDGSCRAHTEGNCTDTLEPSRKDFFRMDAETRISGTFNNNCHYTSSRRIFDWINSWKSVVKWNSSLLLVYIVFVQEFLASEDLWSTVQVRQIRWIVPVRWVGRSELEGR